MAEINHQRIKSLYGEIKGILSQLPLSETAYCYPPSIIEQCNASLNDLNQITGTNYSRHKITENDRWEANQNLYDAQIVRTKLGSVISRLEQEYGFGVIEQTALAPVILTVNQSQQVQVTVTPINEIIQSSSDDELKLLLEELKKEIETTKNVGKTKDILAKILDKSWELFIKILPYVLEKWGQK